ncbi:DUF420 domain-containing protein [Algivirga pacifica]|uniref:DUF420 domain-containing protein n=1 Tax=Algivirga pacifica TaxID=1162670 RepID=A0ABP9DCD4_9BACT
MESTLEKKERLSMWVIGVLSVAIPVVVAILLFMPKENAEIGGFAILPHLNALINTGSAVCLIAGFIAIKKGQKDWHQTFMVSAFILGSLFLVSYVLFHFFGPQTKYGDLNGDLLVSAEELAALAIPRGVYLVILLSHILLSASVVPLVLLAMYYAWTSNWPKHKKIVKWTWPIWTYVAISGVVVYLMISPFYQF